MPGCCYNARSTLSSKFFRSKANRRTPENEGEFIEMNISVEALRLVAYCNFFIMVGVAILLNKTLVAPKLAEGDGTTCGAFNGAFGDRVDPPILPGEGFDVATGSHLVRLFGYNNICANWDYSPSREITAMIYPIFEYCLLLYLFFELVQTCIYFRKGWVSKTYYRVFLFFFVLMFLGCAWFRMIFVLIAYENVSAHTAGFLGLQITLILVALLNTYFIVDSKAEYAWLGGRKGTLAFAFLYIVCNLIVSGFKLTLTCYIVFFTEPAGWSLNTIGGALVGEVVDKIWFVFNAILPLCVATLRCFSEPPLIIKVDVESSKYTDEAENPVEEDEDDASSSEKKGSAPNDVSIP